MGVVENDEKMATIPKPSVRTIGSVMTFKRQRAAGRNTFAPLDDNMPLLCMELEEEEERETEIHYDSDDEDETPMPILRDCGDGNVWYELDGKKICGK